MSILFGVAFTIIGIIIAAGVWAVYARLLWLYRNGWLNGSQVLMEFVEREVAILWAALSAEDSASRAKRREEFGYGPLYVSDEERAKHIFEHRKFYLDKVEELRSLERSFHQYTDPIERKHAEEQIKELRLELTVQRGVATSEQLATWERIKEERDSRK